MTNRDQELWARALQFERQHGVRSFLEAGLKAFELEQEGNWEAAKVWREIQWRIEALEGEEGSSCH